MASLCSIILVYNYFTLHHWMHHCGVQLLYIASLCRITVVYNYLALHHCAALLRSIVTLRYITAGVEGREEVGERAKSQKRVTASTEVTVIQHL
jgi:hypothetical protein